MELGCSHKACALTRAKCDGQRTWCSTHSRLKWPFPTPARPPFISSMTRHRYFGPDIYSQQPIGHASFIVAASFLAHIRTCSCLHVGWTALVSMILLQKLVGSDQSSGSMLRVWLLCGTHGGHFAAVTFKYLEVILFKRPWCKGPTRDSPLPKQTAGVYVYPAISANDPLSSC